MRRAAAAALVLSWAAAPARALAYDFEVSASTIAQAYALAGPAGSPFVSRRRITQQLSLGVYNLLPVGPNRPSLRLVVRMRLDADFGVPPAVTDPTLPSRYIPGLDAFPLDVVYAYVEGRDLLGRRLDFRFGRQIRVDPLGFYLFDGAQLMVRLPYSLALEAYGGFEVRGGLPLSTDRFAADGVQLASRPEGLDPANYPTLVEPDLPWVVAGSLSTHGFMPLHGMLTYRRVFSADRVREEKLGYGVDGMLDSGAFGGRFIVVYDFHRNWLTDAGGGLTVRPIVPLTVGVEVLHSKPSFDADSIFAFFNLYPMNEARLRAQVDLGPRLSAVAWGVGRLFESDPVWGSGAAPVRSAGDFGGGAGLTFRAPGAGASLRLHYEDGWAGLHAGVEAGGHVLVHRDRLRLEARASLWEFRDPFRQSPGLERSGLLFGYVLGARYRLAPPASVLVEYEHDVNRLVGNRFRLVVVLDLRFWL